MAYTATTTTDDNEQLFKAQAHIWNHTFSFINSMSLKCAIQLGIPDIIHSHGNSMTLFQLVDALKLDKSKTPYLNRLLRLLIHSGFFLSTKIVNDNGNDDEKEEENYIIHNSLTSKLLLKDHPASNIPFTLAVVDPFFTTPWLHLTAWFKSNDNLNPFVIAHGRTFWDAIEQEPRFNKSFNEAMERDSKLVGRLLVTGNNKEVFEGLNSLVDVGGGTGTMAKTISEAFPDMKCIVLDLPQVVQDLQGTNNLSYVGGDMFQYIPPADAILFKWTMQNWSDKKCIEILKKCKEAIPSNEKGGKVIIVEMVMGDQNKDYEATQTQLYFDMTMSVNHTGKQRTKNEWEKLFTQAGFSDYKIRSILGLRSVIEAYY